ncbi:MULTISPECIES: glycosyltransferase [Clostridia]|jgi:glycosyltransferase involved in cell wall biosynthesis|uniref:Glycosyltransferase n=1 Tax=Clostridium saudiense TaxID=1414720 RepID=A0ABS2FBT6_9CLOT|nr:MULTISPECIES: glycosyltransferase [Clostridiaceae]MBM6817995.1 glycosyltransferase [Clostridium saudiense]MDO5779431.1 glycosyltransferase [Clostridium sp.]
MKILFIACYSPLINNSASIETLQYLNNLAKIDGNEVHLLTVNFPKNSIYYDEYILSMLDKKVKMHIISGGKIFEKIMPKKSLNTEVADVSKSNKSFIKTLLKKGKSIIAVPDMYLNWAKSASKYGIELAKREKFDVMFSMHEPPSSHICALKIKEEFRDLPWVTYWSDPWLKDSTRANISKARRKFEGSFEKKIVELSDKFIFVTKANRDDYIKSYNIPVEKTFIVTRGYDEKQYSEIKKSSKPSLINKDKINFVYAGEIFSKLRDVNPFIGALNDIKDKNVELYNKLNVMFFGNIDDEDIKNKLMQVENVNVSPRIPYDEALGYMLNSEVLLLFGNKNSKQIPAKIYDYFGADGLIFVILGDENDPIRDVVENKKKCIVVNNNTHEIVNGINKIVSMLENNEKYGPIEEYKWQYISKRLNDILKG